MGRGLGYLVSPRRKPKHIPQRTCIGCRQVSAKKLLVRVVRTGESIQIDSTGKLSGRGAYIHPNHKCWERALSGSLNRALKVKLSRDEQENLLSYMASLPKHDHEGIEEVINS